MIRTYLDAALNRARCTQLEDGPCGAEVHGLRGVIATGSTLEACRNALAEVVEGWVRVRVSKGLDIPLLGTAKIHIRRAPA